MQKDKVKKSVSNVLSALLIFVFIFMLLHVIFAIKRHIRDKGLKAVVSQELWHGQQQMQQQTIPEVADE